MCDRVNVMYLGKIVESLGRRTCSAIRCIHTPKRCSVSSRCPIQSSSGTGSSLAAMCPVRPTRRAGAGSIPGAATEKRSARRCSHSWWTRVANIPWPVISGENNMATKRKISVKVPYPENEETDEDLRPAVLRRDRGWRIGSFLNIFATGTSWDACCVMLSSVSRSGTTSDPGWSFWSRSFVITAMASAEFLSIDRYGVAGEGGQRSDPNIRCSHKSNPSCISIMS